MTNDLTNINNLDSLILCYYPKDNITLANGFVVLSNGIDIIIFIFYTKNITEKIFFSRVYYYNKLDIKLITVEMLDRKNLSFFFSSGVLGVRDNVLL